MSDWTDGYVAEVDYTYGYYHDLNPLRLAVPFLNVGLRPPTIATACELGFGQGVSINIHAAASGIAWYGTDFNPSHTVFARSLAEASGAEIHLFDQSFAEFCARRDLPDFDYISLHGVWSWISAENQRVVVDFLQRKLKLGGVLHVSYNTLPGHAATIPLRHLMLQHAETVAGPTRGIVSRIDGALDFVGRLVALNPAFAVANPMVVERLKTMQGQQRNYLAHEFFNRDWHATPFAEMADCLAAAKLTFACSIHYLDHVDALSMMPEQAQFLAAIPDRTLRQSARDFIVNQQFRRDYWVKGPSRLTPLEQTEGLRGLRFMLVNGPRSELTYSVVSPLGQRDMNRTVYEPLLDALADYQPKTLGELETALAPAGLRLGTILEALIVLCGKGDAAPAQDTALQHHAKPHTDRLNLCLMERARSVGDVAYLASPVLAGGMAASRFQQLFLLAARDGHRTPEALARFAWDVIGPLGQRMLKDGKPLDTAEENVAELTRLAEEFDKRLPILQALQIA